MRIIDNVKYYNSREVADIVSRSRQTINNWSNYSNILEARGEERLIPRPIRQAGNRRYWSENDVEKIKEFASNISRGDMAEYNRKLWGNR